MELRDYIRILRKNWILLLIGVILGAGGGYASAALATPIYQASTKLYVSVQSDASATGDLLQGTSYARQVVTNYIEVIPTGRVLEPVIDELGLDLTLPALARSITVSSPANSVILNVAVTNADPELAAAIANDVAESFIEVAQSPIANEQPDGISPIKVTVLDAASAPAEPSSPNYAMNIALGLLIGLVVALAVAVIRHLLDTRLHGSSDIEAVTKQPLLGAIVNDPDADSTRLIVNTDPRSPRAEAYRSIRTNLQFLDIGSRNHSFVISSSKPGEAKTTSSVNIALALAETGARVALIDGDLRRPRIAGFFGMESELGLSDVLIGRVELVDSLQRFGQSSLYILASGPVPPNPSELLGSHAMDQVLEALNERFDYVLIDSPPILAVTDSAVLSKKTAGVIFICAAERTKRHELENALKTLSNAGGTVLGVVGTMLPTRGVDRYRYDRYSYLDRHLADSEEEYLNRKRSKKSTSKKKTIQK